MSHWQVQDAKARFSEMLDICLEQGPQVVTRRGTDAAVLVPIEQWRKLTAAKPSLKDLLLAADARGDIPVPARGQQRRREAIAFG